MPRLSQTSKRLRAANVVFGIMKRLPREETYRIDGKAFTHKALVALFQEQVDALDAIQSARAALAAAVARERGVARRVAPGLLRLQAQVGQRFRFRPDALADFGWTVPKKPGPKTTASKLQGVERGKATRAARGTMGRKQRLKIRGA